MSLTRVTSVSLATNALLFALKLWGFLMSGSVALFSDAMNSLLDVASSTAVLISVRVGRKAPDREHPFGHSRAEPIAGFVLAVIACVLAVEVLQESIMKFLTKHDHEVSPLLFAILGVAIVSKLAMAAWQRRVGHRANSPAVLAMAVDSRNDVLSSLAALAGVTGAAVGFNQADEIAGLIVGIIILIGGIRIVRDNLDLLLGRSPSDAVIHAVRGVVAAVPGVQGIRFCRGHYLGSELHFEIIIACHGELSTAESAQIADNVRVAAEQVPEVNVAFIHVDTVEGPHHYPELLNVLER
ncbi:MAG: cation transporter [Armatimonadetes bacterium]|nr:cation transporter [Armatimonadota bacterium]